MVLMLNLDYAPPKAGEVLRMVSPVKSSSGDDEMKCVLIALGKALDEFRKLNPNMPVVQMQTFLIAAIETDLSMSELSKRTGLKVSTTSRYLIDLGVQRHEEDTAFGLIERGIDPREPRRARYTLTRKGRALVNRLVATLTSICEDRGGELVDISGKEGR